MGYVLPKGSSKYTGHARTVDGVKPAPKAPVKLPRPVKIPPPPHAIQCTETVRRARTLFRAVLPFEWCFQGSARWCFLEENATRQSRFPSTAIGETAINAGYTPRLTDFPHSAAWLLGGYVVHALATRRSQTDFERVIEALVFSFFIYVCYIP